jgi:hypothetical protein
MQKIPLRNIRIAYQTPLGIFDTAEIAARELARCDFDINLINVVRIGERDGETAGCISKSTEKWIPGHPIEVTVLADDQGFEAPI